MSSIETSSLPECVVCTDILEDPRQLPCGHCYCGPPKTCMNALKHKSNLKCALCGVENKINISDLKPLYGLRDYLKEQKSAISQNSEQIDNGELYCRSHNQNHLKYWCKNCSDLICVICIDSPLHQNHDFVSFRHNFRTILPIILQKNLPLKQEKIEDLNRVNFEIEKHVKRYQNTLDVKCKLEKEKEKINSNWELLGNLVSGSEANPNPDLKLVKWVIDGEAFKRIPLQEMMAEISNPFGVTESGVQATSSSMDQKTQTEPKKTENKSSGTDSIKAEVKGTQTDIDANFANDNNVQSDDYESDSDDDECDNFNHVDINRHSGHQLKVPDPINLKEIIINFPYLQSPPENHIIWSDSLISFGGVFSLGISRVKNRLAVHFLPELLSENREVTVTFDRFTGKGFRRFSVFWIWRDLDMDKYRGRITRYTEVPWVQFLDRVEQRLSATVEFSVKFGCGCN